jgi:hypothetical protein
MTLREKLRKAAELLVELPEEKKAEEETTGESSIRNYQKERWGAAESGLVKNRPDVKATDEVQNNGTSQEYTATARPQEVLLDTKVDFLTIYQQASVPDAPFTAEQMLEMISTLPPEIPLGIRRQMVYSFLKAMGKTIDATSESIAADASRKIEALTTYTGNNSRKTAEIIAVAEKEIASMQARIEEKRNAIENAQGRLAQVIQVCQLESDRLNEVLEFFNVDVPG